MLKLIVDISCGLFTLLHMTDEQNTTTHFEKNSVSDHLDTLSLSLSLAVAVTAVSDDDGDNVKSVSENWSRPHEERKIPTRRATKSTTKMATSHPSYVNTNRTQSSIGAAAIYWRHDGGPPNTGRWCCCDPRFSVRFTPRATISGLHLLEASRHMSHHPTAAHRSNGHGTC